MHIQSQKIVIYQKKKKIQSNTYTGSWSIWRLSTIRLGTHRFIKSYMVRKIIAVDFELGSHYQMMGTNPAQNFGVVLAELCTPARSSIIMVLSQEKETEHMKLLIRTYICISIYHILVLKNIVFIWQSRMSNLEYKGYKNLLFTCLQNPARVQKIAHSAL